MFHQVRKVGYTLGYIMIQMDVRTQRISRMDTDFFNPNALFRAKNKKNLYPSVKSVESVHPFVSQCMQKCNLKMKHLE